MTEGDLPPGTAGPAGDEAFGPREREAAGITLSVGQRTEMMLRGDDRLPAAALSPLDLMRVRMARDGAWSDAMDKAAAHASRRLWAQAYADFASTAPEDTGGSGTGRAWAAAVSLVLPAEPHAVLSDSRYAGEDFRDAVRRVAGHLLGAWTGTGAAPVSAVELADTLRSGLGLRQRWTAPATDTGADADNRTDAEAAPAPAPVAQSGTDADMPDVDMTEPDEPVLDTGGLGDFDLSAWDGVDLDDFDFDFGDFDFGLLGTGDDLAAPDVDMADAEPTALDTDGPQQVFAVPTTAVPPRPLALLPRQSLVTYAPGETRPSADAQDDVEHLAFRVARAGLRNLRTRVPLPKIDIAGFGADARGAGTAQEREQAARQRGDQRARTAYDLFVRKLDDALRTLQTNLPAGRTRLTPKDFKITQRGRARLPGQGAITGLAETVSRADLGRQATIAVTSPGHAAAVEALDAARRDDPELRTGTFDVDAVARRVLHLAPSVLVDPEMRRDLYTTVGRALAAGRAAAWRPSRRSPSRSRASSPRTAPGTSPWAGPGWQA
ncbi:hypothetical protein OVA19_27070 [Streptomyces sp. SL203]|nr:hypothetical protein [Streptomyces sp. SL203]MCY1654175.1 hypothetical protein [Streptomyces sp. SL203]